VLRILRYETQSVHETPMKNKLLVELNALAFTNSVKRKQTLSEVNAEHSRTQMKKNKNKVSKQKKSPKEDFLIVARRKFNTSQKF